MILTPALALGIDFGTSGARAIALDEHGTIHATARYAFPPATPTPHPNPPPTQGFSLWETALWNLLAALPPALRPTIQVIAINGTSATVGLTDPQGTPLTDPLLYNDDRAKVVLEHLRAIAPPDHVVLSATSTLAKLLWWQTHGSEQLSTTHWSQIHLVHQADWLAFLLHGQPGYSDYHNALKLGYDPIEHRYPHWLLDLPNAPHYPTVLAPGTPIGPIKRAIATQFDLPPTCQICAGTTDSTAAFLASGAQEPGDAVTSLGSTLVLKLLSPVPIHAATYGLYSHRLGDLWLVGGASNTGGAVLQHFFSPTELTTLSSQINPHQASPLSYYPLLKPGERFPTNDPQLPPRLEPRPNNPVAFLHGLLESMARIEAQGYHRLQTLGAPPLRRVFSAGGGAHNPTWTHIRARHLNVPLVPSHHTEAAYGTALLALGSMGANPGFPERPR